MKKKLVDQSSTLNDVAKEIFPPKIYEALSNLEVREAKTWPDRLAYLGTMAGWILLITFVDAVIYLATSDHVVLTLFSIVTLSITLVVAKFLFKKPGGARET